MQNSITIFEIKGQKRHKVGTLTGNEVPVGRAPGPGGITLAYSTVSSTHGVFARHGSDWFYKDCGSTNGSFINSAPVAEGEWVLVRNGTIVKVADITLELEGSQQQPGTSSPKIKQGTARKEKVPLSSVFGREIPGDDDSQPWDTETVGHTSQPDETFTVLEDKIILGAGLLLVAALFIVALWWALS